MRKSDLDNLIGLSVTEGVKLCDKYGFRVELYPEEAKLTWVMKQKTIIFRHIGVIISGWTPGNINDIEVEVKYAYFSSRPYVGGT